MIKSCPSFILSVLSGIHDSIHANIKSIFTNKPWYSSCSRSSEEKYKYKERGFKYKVYSGLQQAETYVPGWLAKREFAPSSTFVRCIETDPLYFPPLNNTEYILISA